jgi:mRNA-degrading endonuclease RelE of RelBE toxin-antitoxin system
VSLRLDWKPGALRDLERLDPSTRERIVAAVTKLAETRQGDVRKLQGKNPPEYRLRVGALRVRFAWHQAGGSLIVLSVFKRGQGYE